MPSWKSLILLRVFVFFTRWRLRIKSLFGDRYATYLSLNDRATDAVSRGRFVGATAVAEQLLSMAEEYRADWNYGNAVHQGHLILGRAALARQDLATARTELLIAGKTPGSPQLATFGPNMQLAKDLLAQGEREIVLEYLELCRSFWELGSSRLDEWCEDVRRGRVPDFRANLVY